MKKTIVSALTFLVIIFLFSCNQATEKKAEVEKTDQVKATASKYNFDSLGLFKDEICDKAGGIANFLIPSAVAKSMTDHFDDIYGHDDAHNNVEAHRRGYWMDACTLYSIADFLRTQKKYDGIRLRFGCELKDDDVIYPHHQYKRRTTMFVFPTTLRPNTSEPSNPDHTDDIKATITNTCSASEFIRPFKDANQKMGAYDKIYRKHLTPGGIASKDSLSMGVWIDSCVVFYIEKLLKTADFGFDGINIKTAAYSSFVKDPKFIGQMHPHQSTIVITPTTPGTAKDKHTENAELFDEIVNYFNQKVGATTLNHGQICPTKCQ